MHNHRIVWTGDHYECHCGQRWVCVIAKAPPHREGDGWKDR